MDSVAVGNRSTVLLSKNKFNEPEAMSVRERSEVLSMKF